jgi:hypothetical protein
LRDGQHLSNGLGMLGVVVGGVTEERLDGGQPSVPGAHSGAPFGFQMIQETVDQCGVQVGDVQIGGVLPGLRFGVGQ